MDEGMEMETENPIEMLKEDHQAVQDLFSRFEEADNRSRQRIADEALMMLEIHAKLEEDVVYPAIREGVGDDEMIDEALEEHHVATMLIKELHKMKPKDERYAAKFKVLSEMVRHHIEEEENETFPQAEKADIDWSEVGREATKMREKLMRKMGGGQQRKKAA
ncbi:Hemerythrin HHE cation binding region [Nitrospira moscoviensis]|uniref:Hemerythrin HHE cation binding region n=2 Tax=Nitrospira moscoviensis TaxID=42253 RepID=A0A0K2GDY6_NITMO|nr:Hemerythrin HHE cation binding region [Nitrospira moscoviensis]